MILPRHIATEKYTDENTLARFQLDRPNWWNNHNKTKQNKTVCIFYGLYYTYREYSKHGIVCQHHLYHKQGTADVLYSRLVIDLSKVDQPDEQSDHLK